jgi:uncharacterized protein YecE (DUF72 family)
MPGPVSIGIAGWSYPDWEGIVYTQPKMDQLTYVSGFVDCIEINSTFYRPPFERMVQGWADKTAHRRDFFFTAKLHQSFTHEGKLDPEIIRQFHTGLQPLSANGRLRSLLAQFRYDFVDSPQTRQHLGSLVGAFSDAFSLVLELRHRSWERQESLDFLKGLGVTVCNLDYPVSTQSFNLQRCTVGTTGYFRLHGRNTQKWFSKASRDEVYNYYYNPRELDQIHKRIDDLSKAFKHLTVIMNNHYRGAELANAIELKFLVTGQKQQVPEGLLKTYPDLARVALPVTGDKDGEAKSKK